MFLLIILYLSSALQIVVMLKLLRYIQFAVAAVGPHTPHCNENGRELIFRPFGQTIDWERVRRGKPHAERRSLLYRYLLSPYVVGIGVNFTLTSVGSANETST